MKAILEFNLDDPDDRDRHENALNSSIYLRALTDISNIFRNERKYGGKPIDETKFYEILADHKIVL